MTFIVVTRQADGASPWRVEGIPDLEREEFPSAGAAMHAVSVVTLVSRPDWAHHATKIREYYGTHVPTAPRGSRRSTEGK